MPRPCSPGSSSLADSAVDSALGGLASQASLWIFLACAVAVCETIQLLRIRATKAEAHRPEVVVGFSIFVTSQLQTGDEFPNEWANLVGFTLVETGLGCVVASADRP